MKKLTICVLCIAMIFSLLVPSALAADRTISDSGIDLIISFEGFSSQKTWDYAQYSIGYGCNWETYIRLFPEEAATGTISEDTARALLQAELGSVENLLNRFLDRYRISVNQNQFDALVSFSMNVGTGWTGMDCLLTRMLMDSPSTWTSDRVQEAFGVWCHAGGVELPGLVSRRADEAALFLSASSALAETADSAVTIENPILMDALEFDDVDSAAWYADSVAAVSRQGLMQGCGDGLFQPEETLTWAQLVQILARYDGADLPPADEGQAWYAPAIAWAEPLLEDLPWDADAPIARQYTCVVLSRYLADAATVQSASRFLDHEEIDPAAEDAVYRCAELGLVNGIGDGLFDPQGTLTRAQAAVLITRMQNIQIP